MFTTSQLSQLAAAAWASGPALACISTASEHHVSRSGHASTTYSVSYHPATLGTKGVTFCSGPQPCPFAAVLEAIEQAATVGTQVSVSTALRIVLQAQAQFTNLPAGGAIVCATCGEAADHFQQCGCCYVPVPAYFHE